MTWSSNIAYLRGLDVLSKVVEQVPTDAWRRPSPCAGWRAIDVLGHVGAATDMGIRILRGQPMSFDEVDPPGDAVDGEPSRWWAGLASQARQAVEEIDEVDLERIVDSPGGGRSVREGLSFPAADLFVHAWDIARATEVTVAIPEEAVPFVRSLGELVPSEMMRSPGVFGPEVEVPDDASEVDRLLAWTGRDPSWTPSPMT